MTMAISDERTSIWLDCDTGHDDAFAILLAVYNARANILGISTVHGNASVEHTTHNSLAVLEAMGALHVPVHKGRDKPLRRDPSFAPGIHGESGLDGVTLLPKELSASPLSESLTDVANTILEEPPNTVHIVATGPLTNIAILFSWSAELAIHIAGLHIMGGAVGGGFTDAPLGKVKGQGERFGNHSPWAEFNIYADPEAARVIFNNQRLAGKTTLVPLDLTHLVRGTTKVQHHLFGASKEIENRDRRRKLSAVRRLFQQILNFFASTYSAQFGIHDGPPLHDPIAVWSALQPDLLYDSGERYEIDVVVQEGSYDPVQNAQNNVGQTIIRPSQSGKGVRVPRGLDLDRFWIAIDEAMRTAETTVGTDGLFDSPMMGSPSVKPPAKRATSEEKETQKASLNAWRSNRQEQLRNGDSPGL